MASQTPLQSSHNADQTSQAPLNSVTLLACQRHTVCVCVCLTSVSKLSNDRRHEPCTSVCARVYTFVCVLAESCATHEFLLCVLLPKGLRQF